MKHAPAISDYAIIGDGRSVALVSRQGSIDWLCWPRFDSPSLFSSLLDPTEGGTWSIRVLGATRTRRTYLHNTNILLTEFDHPDGVLRLTDLMPIFSEEEKKQGLVAEHEVLRVLECLRGVVDVEVQFRPRLHYGRDRPRLRPCGTLGVRIEDGPHLYTFRCDAPVHLDGEAAIVGRFRMSVGQRKVFSLTYDSYGPGVLPPLRDAMPAVVRSARWWREWASKCQYEGPYQAEVLRSLLVLKLLAYAPSGAIVAAPTTSLPEKVGGSLNWDYRYCWIRDASLTVYALLNLGYFEEAEGFIGWLLHSTRLTRPKLKVLYDVYGRQPPSERLLIHLDGYRHSKPVRVHNAASTQLQLDVYGEVIDAVAQLCRRGAALDLETKHMLVQFGEYVCDNWWRPDQGIWEPREPPSHHTHSRLLCWTAVDRLLELHKQGLLPRLPVERLEQSRAYLKHDLETRSWSESEQSYTQVQGGRTVDASLLLMSWYGFDRADNPRLKATFERIRERLEVVPGLLYRNEESLPAGEGTFGICSFWAVEYLARGGGSLEEAEAWFQSVLRRSNDVGMISEEFDPETGEMLGNVPQSFSHVGLISAALAIELRRKKGKAEVKRKPPTRPQPESHA